MQQLATVTIALIDQGGNYLVSVNNQETGENLAMAAIDRPAAAEDIRDAVNDMFHPAMGDAGSAIADSIAEHFASEMVK